MSYPTVELQSSVEVQPPINVSTIFVKKIAEDPITQTVDAFVDYGPSQAWVSVLDPSNYFSNWGDTDVTSAIQTWAHNSFPPAKS